MLSVHFVDQFERFHFVDGLVVPPAGDAIAAGAVILEFRYGSRLRITERKLGINRFTLVGARPSLNGPLVDLKLKGFIGNGGGPCR
jgi:hypothetical protein